MKGLILLGFCLIFCKAQEGKVNCVTKTEVNISIPIPDGRIVGGKITNIEKFPYQVSLSYLQTHICGGSIIRNRVVATAAHCVRGRRPQLLTIRAGSSQHNQGGVVVQVQKVIIHPQFNPSSMDKDIALLFLSKDLLFGSTIQSIELANLQDVLKPNAALIVSGWGATSEGSRTSNPLRYVQVELINQQTCSSSYGLNGKVTSNMFCAGIVSGGRDSCQGDSGGPLIAYRNDKAILYGIVSWGYGCARPRYPGVYTKVQSIHKWAERNILVLGF